MKLSKRIRSMVSAALIVSMTATTGMTSMAAPPGEGGKAAPAGDSWTEIAAVDFSDQSSVEGLPNGWRIDKGSGSADLVDAGEGAEGKALKLTRDNTGGTLQLLNESLGISESNYPYVSVETKIKLGTEAHENQWSIPYLADNSGNTAYTLFADGSWDKYKTHVGSKNNVQEAGKAAPGQWQTVRMDIDLKADTFRVSVDGVYVLYDEAARAKADSLKSIKFYADSWNKGTIYIQSVKVMGQKAHEAGAVYYVSNNGDDSAAGTSAETAWKTLGRVNREHFIPGDQILFQRGGVWEDETLFPQGSGDAGDKIVIGSYGDGTMPKISTNGKAADAVCLYNQEYWEISELDISNTVEGFRQLSGDGSGDGTAPTGNNASRNDADGSKLGDYRGIHIAGRDVASLKGYHIHDLLVHDVTGVVSWIGDTGVRDAGIWNNAGLDNSKRTGGILIECLKPSGSQPTQFSDIVIEGNEFINNSFAGITVKQWNGSGNQYGNNPGWANRNRAGGAPDYYDANWRPHSNIIIQDNYINQGASAYACNGIYLTSSRDSVIQRNVLEHIGTCGIELYFTDNVAVQYNEVSDVIIKGGGADDNAIDPDWRVTNALIQYNYIHNAGEGFLLCGVQFNSGVIRYNLVQDCKRSYVHYSMGSGYFQIYNNIFYRSKDGNGTNNFDPWGGGTAAYFNNVFYDAKEQGFNFSGGSSFAYNNNAYYGTAPTSKDKNPVILTENPFEGEAPSLERKGDFDLGALLEANGLRPKTGSPLIGAGVNVDPNGFSIDDGLKSKGTKFNFTSLDKADMDHLGDCIYISRKDYPTFELENEEATLATANTQITADATAPTIGMFEVPIDKNAVIIRGKVTDSLNPVAGAAVEIKVGDKTVTAVTNETGSFTVLEGLIPGEAVITVTYEYNGEKKEMTENATLAGGKVTQYDITVPLTAMPEAFEHTLIDETFDQQTDPVNFGFTNGTEIKDGKLVLNRMNNYSVGVKKFDTNVTAQKAIDLTFDYQSTSGNKQGFEFRDSYGRLLFAICAAPGKNDLRPSVTGDAVEDGKAASTAEPVWDHIDMNKSVPYTIRLHADFENKTVSYSIAEKGGKVVAQKVDEPTEASNLAKMIHCSWYDSQPQYFDNFKMTAPEEIPDLPLRERTVYAFGDSIVAGHKYRQSGFADFAAAQEGMELQKFAVNGATIMDAGYEGGKIVSQIAKAPEEAPDYIIFDGGTNDAEFIYKKSGEEKDAAFGTVSESMDPDSFDQETFAGAFEQTVYEMKEKWPDAQLIYVAVHKLGSRDHEVQEKLRELERAVCNKWEVAMADVYGDTDLDTSKEEMRNKYTFNDLGSNGLPGTNGSGTHPNFAAIEEFYIPVVTEALRNPEVPSAEDKTKSRLQVVDGLVNGQESGEFEKGEAVEIKADEKEGFTFKEWQLTEGDAKIASPSNAETTVTIGGQDSVITALYGDPDVELYQLTVEGGSGSGNYAEGEQVSIKADKVKGKVFKEWKVEDGNAVIASPSNAQTTVTMGDEDSLIKAIFDKIEDVIKRITGIRIKSKPAKTEYYIGEDFTAQGLVVEATGVASPSNAQMTFTLSEEKNNLEVDSSEFDSDNPGEYEITVRYRVDIEDAENYDEVFEDTFTVEVLDEVSSDEDYYITKIEIRNKPAKTTYEVGDEIDLTGLVVIAKRKGVDSGGWLSDLVLNVDEDLEVDYDFSTPGTKKAVTVSYTGPYNKDLDEKTFKKTFYVKVTGGSGRNNDDDDDGGSSSSWTGTTITTDAVKGKVDTQQGIITGSGSGYSSWQQDEKGWTLTYANGTKAAGTMVTAEDGTTYEQYLWEMVNGAWYPFGADGYVKDGMIFDPVLGGYFYVDLNAGMKTGWQQVDGKWRYFNPVSDGRRGIMLTDTWIDGCYIDKDGVWIG